MVTRTIAAYSVILLKYGRSEEFEEMLGLLLLGLTSIISDKDSRSSPLPGKGDTAECESGGEILGVGSTGRTRLSITSSIKYGATSEGRDVTMIIFGCFGGSGNCSRTLWAAAKYPTNTPHFSALVVQLSGSTPVI